MILLLSVCNAFRGQSSLPGSENSLENQEVPLKLKDFCG